MKRKRQRPAEAVPAVVKATSAPWTAFDGREAALLALVLLLGIALRLHALSRSAVEHFDEGVYASNLYFGPPDYTYPLQQLYAPPLLPTAISMGMLAGVEPNLAALLPAFLAGCATIAAVWWLGRSWFGPEVGLAAAALVALSNLHIAFSAAALTDVPLGLWLVLAVHCIGKSLVAGTLRVPSAANGTRSVPATIWAAAGGVFTGLAWWTKYNGWLPLAIGAAALPVLWLFLRPPRRQVANWVGCFAITAVVAVAVWSPYYLSLQSQGGYTPIAANHAKYVVGFAGWPASAARQIANQYIIERLASPLGIALSLALPGLLSPGNTWERFWRGGLCIGAGALAFLWTAFVVAGAGALLGLIGSVIVVWRGSQRDGACRRHALGLSLVGCWWLGLLVTTPLYTPYPRLAIPWLLATSLGMGLLSSDALRATLSQSAKVQQMRSSKALAYAVLIGIFLVPWLFVPEEQMLLEPRSDRRELIEIARTIRATENDAQPQAVYVFGEPALFFQLRVAGEDIASVVQSVPIAPAAYRGQPMPTYLVAGPHAQQNPEFQRQMALVGQRWELIHEFDYHPSHIVWLDLNDPRKPPDESAALDRMRFYRFRP